MLKKAVIFAVLLCFGIGNLCFADSSRMLDKNTELHPQGWSVGETIKFKKKTAVRLNDIGEVISGTLADDTYLRPHGWQRIINDNYFVSAYTGGAWFPRHHRYWQGSVYNIALPSYGHLRYKDDTAVAFSKQGTVLSGTIASRATVSLGEGQYGFVTFADSSILEFYDNGAVKMGTLNEDTQLRPAFWQQNMADNSNAGFVEFKKDTCVYFDENGLVTAGTIKEAAPWKTGGTVTTLTEKTEYKFTENGAEKTPETNPSE